MMAAAAAAVIAASVAGTKTRAASDLLPDPPRRGTDGSPLWEVASGTWKVTEEGYVGRNCGGHFMAEGVQTGRSEWGDYILSVEVKLNSRGADWRDGPWIGFRNVADAGYTLAFYNRMTALHKRSGSKTTGDGQELATHPVTVKDAQWHRVVIRAQGNEIRIVLDGSEIIRVVDDDWNDSPAVLTGGITLCARRFGDTEPDTEVVFRNLGVEPLGARRQKAYTLADARRGQARKVSVLDFLGEQRNRRYVRIPRKVLAFYYTWYGRPERNGRWIHWDKVNPEAHDIATSTHYPAKGAYDSRDPELIDSHIRLAKANGLDGFICTWWGPQTFDDRAFVTVLERARKLGFELSLYWETVPGKGKEQIDKAVSDLLYLLDRYGDHPAYLKVDGKPVFFVYGRVMGQVPQQSWPEIIATARQRSGKDFLLIADGYRDGYARMFDGIHTYNIAGALRDKKPDEIRAFAAASFPEAVAKAKNRARISCVTIIPGYDDTKIRKPGLVAPRWNGETYRIVWDEAIKADPDWILITSWNEWHEGSEIEPSWEHGDAYVKITREFAARFKKTPCSNATIPEIPAGVSPEKARSLRKLYAGRTVGILPDFSGDAAFWLADTGVPVRELTWDDVIDPAAFTPSRFPVILYAAGEKYVQSLDRTDDVDGALIRYLNAGGVLVVLSPQPFPFYYNEKGEAVANAGAFGIPIGGSGAFNRQDVGPDAEIRGWEIPPQGVKLSFRVDTRMMPGLPTSAPFPAGGDLRWRPCGPADLGPEDTYLPLARLQDESGRVYGDGVAFVQRQTKGRACRVFYAWMRMPDVLGRERLFHALFTLAGRQATKP